MPSKFLVVELRSEESLGKIVEAVAAYSERIAVVDEVPGIFTSLPPLLQDETLGGTSLGNVPLPTKSRKRQHQDAEELRLDSEIFPFGELSGDGLKENLNGGISLGESILADGTEIPLNIEHHLMRAFRKTVREEGETALSVRRKTTEQTLVCGLCQSKMTLRASYGRTRLREHVMRHLDSATAQCGYCDFKGILREHVRRHIILKHKDQPQLIIELQADADYNDRFDSLWKVCFPDTCQIQPRMTSHRARANESAFFDGPGLPMDDDMDEQKPPTMSPTNTDKEPVSQE